MTIQPLYRTPGVSSSALTGIEQTAYFRITASEGKHITKDGIETYAVIDTTDISGWHEVDVHDPLTEEEVFAELEVLLSE